MRRLASRPGRGAEQAFAAARAEACRGFEHRGYIGTIAEKDDFALVADSPLTPDAAEEYAVPLLNTDDQRIRDNRGPLVQSRSATAPGCSWATPPPDPRAAAAANRPGSTPP